eukprot:4929074-Pyramimonas_sp.AAC.1
MSWHSTTSGSRRTARMSSRTRLSCQPQGLPSRHGGRRLARRRVPTSGFASAKAWAPQMASSRARACQLLERSYTST